VLEVFKKVAPQLEALYESMKDPKACEPA